MNFVKVFEIFADNYYESIQGTTMFNIPIDNQYQKVIHRVKDYIESNPSCRLYSGEYLYNYLVDEKVITKAEADMLKKQPLLKFANINATDYSKFNYTVPDQKSFKPSDIPVVSHPKKEGYHPQAFDLKVDSKGVVDKSQFELATIKKDYPPSKYRVETDSDGSIRVTNKSTGKPVMSLDLSDEFRYVVTKYYEDGSTTEASIYKISLELLFYEESFSNGASVSKSFLSDGKVYSQTKTDTEGNREREVYFSDGSLRLKEQWLEDSNSPVLLEEYSGKKRPWKISRNGKVSYPLVDDLKKDIYARNSIGLPTTRKTLKENVLERITEDNCVEIFDEYKKQTGEDLVTAIQGEWGLDKALRDELSQHVEALYARCADSYSAGKYLADSIRLSLSNSKNDEVEQKIKLLNSNNIKYFLFEYRRKASEYYEQKDVLNIDKTQLQLLSKGIFSAINSLSIDKEQKDRIYNHLIKCVVDMVPENQRAFYMKDLQKNKDNPDRMEIDLLRILNKLSGDFRNPNIDKKQISHPPNGKFDGLIKQGQTGDCWLLAGINSIVSRPKAKAYLESLIKFDPVTGNAVVNLKGVNKSYTITKEELEMSTFLSTGDYDARYIEIAMDKYIRDLAYENAQALDKGIALIYKNSYFDHVTIDANSKSFLYNALFGTPSYKDSLCSDDIDPLLEDFSRQDRVYSLSHNLGEDMENVLKNSKGEYVSFVDNHAYSVLGSNKDEVYLVNPWDSSDILTMSRQDFNRIYKLIDMDAYDISHIT